jgi:AraC family transcriptional regulator
MAARSMLWDELPPEPQREVLSHYGVTLGGMGFNFVEEAISVPTDWRFKEDHHVIVAHRNGRLRSMDSEFEHGPSGQILPKIGDIWVIPAGQRYAALARGDTVGFCEMKIPTRLLRGETIAPRLGHRDPLLYQATDRLSRLGQRDDDLANILRETLGETIRLHLLDDYVPPSDASRDRVDETQLKPAEMRMLVEWIDDQLDIKHSLTHMAALVGRSIPDLIAAFSKSFGTTPYQFVIARRIRRAKDLLGNTRASVTEIGLAVGFSTPSHFATSFKQIVGVTPSAYRNTLLF